MKRIIDNKRVDLTDTEFEMYQAICRSYDRPNFKGEDLFRDLFETNSDAIIVFVRPPTRNFSSMEVWLFLISIMNNQHIRICHEQVESFCREGKDNIAVAISELKELMTDAKQLIDTLKSVEGKDSK